MTYTHRSVLTLGALPPTNAGYQRWFPELRRRDKTAQASSSAPAAQAYPKRWLPEVAARLKRQERPRVSR